MAPAWLLPGALPHAQLGGYACFVFLLHRAEEVMPGGATCCCHVASPRECCGVAQAWLLPGALPHAQLGGYACFVLQVCFAHSAALLMQIPTVCRLKLPREQRRPTGSAPGAAGLWGRAIVVRAADRVC